MRASDRAINDEALMTRLGARVRIVELLVAVWLFASAFLWEHTPARTISTSIVALLMVAISFVARRVNPRVRYFNVALALWLVASLWIIEPRLALTTVNDLCVAAAILVLSLVPSRAQEATTRSAIA